MTTLYDRLTAGLSYGPGCWEWTRAIGINGYGYIREAGKTILVHRVAYEYFNGCTVPDGWDVNHDCFNTRCANPDHLTAMTHRDNMRYSIERGRLPHCERQDPGTHCKHGHERTEETTYRHPAGNLVCRVCQRAANARYKARKNGTT